MKTKVKTILMTLLFVTSFTFTSCAQKTNEKKYWSDVVTSKPEGFKIAEDGNITISDAEGFAWIISVVNGLNGEKGSDLEGKTIFITNDLDMSEYRWTPLKAFKANIYGDNHTIKGLPILKLFEGEIAESFSFDIKGVTFRIFDGVTVNFPEYKSDSIKK